MLWPANRSLLKDVCVLSTDVHVLGAYVVLEHLGLLWRLVGQQVDHHYKRLVFCQAFDLSGRELGQMDGVLGVYCDETNFGLGTFGQLQLRHNQSNQFDQICILRKEPYEKLASPVSAKDNLHLAP